MVVKRNDDALQRCKAGRDLWYHELMAKASADCPPEPMNAEDPLFILYTSGSTGKPKGVVHTTAGYLLHAALTHKYVFDIHDDDIYWCTADIGWVTGHSYIVYGPLANGATTSDVRRRADLSRRRPVLADLREVQGEPVLHRPTAIRSLIRQGDEWVEQIRPELAARPGLRGRADQSRSLDVVLRA